MLPKLYQIVCCVSGCTSNKRDHPKLSFFKLPTLTSRRCTWIELLKISKVVSAADFTKAFVCSKHFDNSAFGPHFRKSPGTCRRTRLNRKAIPSLHLPVAFATNDELQKKRKRRQRRTFKNRTQTEVQDISTSHSCEHTVLAEEVAATSSALKHLKMYKKPRLDPESDEESFHLPLYDDDEEIFFDDESINSENSASTVKPQDNVEQVQNSETVSCEINSVKAHDQLLNSSDGFCNESSINLEETAVVDDDNVEKPIPPRDAEDEQVRNTQNSEINNWISEGAGAVFEEQKVENANKRIFSGNDLNYSKDTSRIKNNEFPLSSKSKKKKFTAKDIEEFCMQKICQVLFYNSDVGNANYALQKQEDLISSLRKDINSLTNHIHHLKALNKQTMELKQLNSLRIKSVKNPVKITRSVGLQVKLRTVKEPNQRTNTDKENTLPVIDSNLMFIKESTTYNNEKAPSSTSLILMKALANAEIFDESDILTKYLQNNEPEEATTNQKTTSTDVIDLTE